MGQRIVVYSHDTFGLGNVRRSYALANHLADRLHGAKILFLTGSRCFHMLPRRDEIEFVKLPELRRTQRGAYSSRSEGVEIEPLVRARREILLGAARGFRPDLLVVDKTPLGIGGELQPTLDWMRRKQRRVVLALRDILDEPRWTRRYWRTTGQFKAVQRFYDGIWVFGDERVYSTGKVYGLERTRTPIHYCGYIVQQPWSGPVATRRSASCAEVDAPGSKPILVTVGGGEDGGELLELTAGALESDARLRSAPIDVVLGPYLPDDVRERVAARFSGLDHVRFHDFIPNLPARIAAARAVVCMAGYNTVSEVLQTPTPALVLPRTRPGQEQLIRARRMSELGYINAVVAGRGQQSRDAVPRIAAFLSAQNGVRSHRPRLDGLDSAARLVELAA